MKYTLKKVLTLVLTLLIVSFLTFIAFQVVPGDSAVTQLGTNATEENIEALREAMNLNGNVLVRYGRWLSSVFTGDFGISSQYKIPVSSLILERMPVTIWLAALSFLLFLFFPFLLVLWQLRKKGKGWTELYPSLLIPEWEYHLSFLVLL